MHHRHRRVSCGGHAHAFYTQNTAFSSHESIWYSVASRPARVTPAGSFLSARVMSRPPSRVSTPYLFDELAPVLASSQPAPAASQDASDYVTTLDTRRGSDDQGHVPGQADRPRESAPRMGADSSTTLTRAETTRTSEGPFDLTLSSPIPPAPTSFSSDFASSQHSPSGRGRAFEARPRPEALLPPPSGVLRRSQQGPSRDGASPPSPPPLQLILLLVRLSSPPLRG